MRAESVNAWLVGHPRMVDGALAAMLALIVVPSTLSLMSSRASEWWGLLWGLAMVVPFGWWRARPELVALGVAAGHVVHAAVSAALVPSLLLVPLALYGVAAWGNTPRARGWLVFGSACAVYAGFHFTGVTRGSAWVTRMGYAVVGAGAFEAVVAAAWVMGRLARVRQDGRRVVVERAEAIERERRQSDRLAAAQERARIAREMHDVVAHSLAVIVVQADGGRYVAANGPDPDRRLATAAQALDTISETARAALAETRRLVGVLRSDDALELRPAATLDRLPALVNGLAAAGFPVTLDLIVDDLADGADERVSGVSADVQMAAYRIVQESLTNVLKHAGPGAAAAVTVRRAPTTLAVSVTDTGGGSRAAADSRGNGIVGMRERVAALGGRLTTGDRPGGGFEVVATLPLHPPRARPHQSDSPHPDSQGATP